VSGIGREPESTAQGKSPPGSATGSTSDRLARLWPLLVTAVVLLGLLARGPRLCESLWYDEIAAWRDYGARGPQFIVTSYQDPANHIAHTLLTWFSVSWLEGTIGRELALRVPALLFSLASIVAIYRLAKTAGGRSGGRAIGMWAALLAAVAPVAVLEGAEARGYSMMVFFAAASTWQMIVALEHRRPWLWIPYAALCALGIWSHMTMVFLPVGHALWLAWHFQRELRNALYGTFGVALAAIATFWLYLPVLGQIRQVRGTFAAAEGDEPSPLGIEGLHTLLQMGASWYWWAALPGLIVALVGFRRAMGDAAARRVISLSLLGLPIMVITILAGGSWMYARFALFALPGAIVLLALGLDGLFRYRRLVGLAAMGVLAVCFTLDLALRPPKQPLRDAAAYVVQQSRPTDRVLVIGLRHQVFDIYAGDLQIHHCLHRGADLDRHLAEQNPQWVIMLYPRGVGAEPQEMLAQHSYRIVRRFDGWADWGDGDVIIMKR
jgi:mannosyltransferase